MSRLRAFELAIELATRQRDAQAQKHAQAQRNCEFARNQLAQLQGYASDTDARWVGSGMPAVSGELIRHHYQFVDRLQQAVQMQHGVIANMDRQLASAHQVLLQAEFRLAGLEQVLKTRRAAAQRVVLQREQRATDEFASQRHAQRQAHNAS
jgi:flagellar FliJ protein